MRVALVPCLLVIAMAAGSARAGTAAFNYITPVDVTPGTAGSWQDVDVSAHIPSGATGVIVHFENGRNSDTSFGFRKNGSTDNRTDLMYPEGHLWAMVGVDGARLFEAYISSTDAAVNVWLVGYTLSGVTFFTDAIDKSLTGTGSWTDIDISAHTGGDTAIGVIVEICGAYEHDYGVRKNGSTDNRLEHGRHTWAIIGVDGSEIFEGHITNTGMDFFVVGYVTAGATFFTNAVNKSLGSTGAWVDIDIGSDTGAETASGAFIEVYAPTQSPFGLRKNGSSENITQKIRSHTWGIVELDANEVFEGHINNTDNDYFLVGYSIAGSTPDAPSALGPTAFASGLCSTDSTPALDFTQSDDDVADTLAFQIQIDDSSDFSSAVVDYQSGTLAQGATGFTVGQAAGSGTYTTGSSGQALTAAAYYWRVRSHDGTSWGAWSTANSGAVAFDIAASCPQKIGPVGASECGGSGCDYNTIQTAIDAASPGDTLTLYRRTDDAANNECFDEHITINKANVTLQGASTTPASAACIGPSTGGDIITITADGVILDGLHLSGKANDGAAGTNVKGAGGRASGNGVLISGSDIADVTLRNCTIDFTAGDNVRYDGDQDADGVGQVTIEQCYLHHADTGRNVRIIGGGGSTADRHLVRNNLIHTGQGVLVSGTVDYITIQKNVIKGWPYYGHLAGDYPELRSAGFGGGWRYYSNAIAGVWISSPDPADAIIQHNLIIGTRWGIRVNTAGVIKHNTVVNPFNASQYDFDGTIAASAVRDHTIGIMVADGFAGTIQNNLLAVTADNRATGEPGQASSPYYSPGITGYGIAFLDDSGTLGGASITNNTVWGFVDTDGVTDLNYGTGITAGATNVSVDPGFAADTADESNGGSDPCLADGNGVGDTRCYELYEDNYFLGTTDAAGSCHASVLGNTAGAAEYVDLSKGGVRDPETHDASALDDCSPAADSATSRGIDFGAGSVGTESGKNGGSPNLGAFGGTTRASTSANLMIVGIDVGAGGIRAGNPKYSGPGIVQPRDDGITVVNIYFNRAFSASSASFVVRDLCDTANLTAPTVDLSGASTAPFKAALTWSAGTLTGQAVRIHVLGDGADRIVDDASAEALDGEIAGLSNGTLPSGDGTAGGDARFVVYALTGDADGDGVVEGATGEDDRVAVTGYANYPAGTCSACAQDVDGDGDIDSADLAVVTAADNSVAETCSASVDVRVASGNDDAEESSSGSIDLTSSDLELVEEATTQTVGMRFDGIAVPAGVTITSATIQFQVDETDSGSCSLTLRGEAADDPVAFTSTSNDITDRATTTASVAWSPPDWTSVGQAGAGQRTPDLKTVLQEIVDRAGWSSGNAVVVIVTGSGSRTAESYNGDSAAAPLLHVEYEF